MIKDFKTLYCEAEWVRYSQTWRLENLISPEEIINKKNQQRGGISRQLRIENIDTLYTYYQEKRLVKNYKTDTRLQAQESNMEYEHLQQGYD